MRGQIHASMKDKVYSIQLKTCVVSCDLNDTTSVDSKLYTLVLEDTILFPEGGGQPSDKGTINGITVNDIKRNGKKALHLISVPFNIGENVVVTLEWERRFDHMQQHTGQHLITALAESMFNFKTTSWTLGETVSFIELDVPCITAEAMKKLEQKLNEKIRDCIPVTINSYIKGSPELSEVRTRLELPDDHDGPIRVINIEGIDSNTCCGTHVKNTSELQVIKLLFNEKGKKNKTNLYFLTGNRVLHYMDGRVRTEKLLNTSLGCKSDNLVERVQKLQTSLKLALKCSLSAVRDIALLEAKLFKLSEPKPKYFSLHKKNAEVEFITFFLNEVRDNTVLFFLTVGDRKSGWQFTLAGPEVIVQEYGPKICALLGAKGAGKKDRYQGKFNKNSAIEQVEVILKNAVL